MICTFFGHRDAPSEVIPLLQEVLQDLIERHGVKQFYVGNQGNFDRMTYTLLAEFERSHCIQYAVTRSFGGAAKWKALAAKKRMIVMELSEMKEHRQD